MCARVCDILTREASRPVLEELERLAGEVLSTERLEARRGSPLRRGVWLDESSWQCFSGLVLLCCKSKERLEWEGGR